MTVQEAIARQRDDLGKGRGDTDGHLGEGGRAEQPYEYVRRELVEPDWRRFPGWRDVTAEQWRDAQWQRVNCVRNIRQLRRVVGDLLTERFYEDLDADHREMATMSMLLPPQMLNTMAREETTDPEAFTDAFLADPVRRYMLPVRSDRHPVWPSHPHSSRDSLHEAEMWVVEGLTHRYPTKVLAEMLSTCPQYCGHCTRMDLVGNSTPQVDKLRLGLKPVDRQDRMIQYLRETPGVRDVVVSGGDVANMPWHQLESFLMRLLEIETVRDVRLASKALAGLPQHWLQPKVVEGLERVARTAARRGVNLAIHTHVNHVNSVTPLVAEAARTALAVGVRDVRNQGVLMRGVNDSAEALLDLCFALQGEAGVLPYYFYMCDMIPNAEHWRLAVWEAQRLQHAIMGYLPGYATPRLICDVPYVGKRWVHQLAEYDHEHGVSYWTKNYRTGIEAEDPDALTRRYPYYDPIYTLDERGQRWWADQ
ncbi:MULTISPECIES: lysine 2,3-aminomutase [Actinoalloteichus]|uniref:Lysine 2,3-aminomutase n=1 Tax=Actinoalloteichus caeruleus DSM 43889 TaxID=1120930 RepID=A0ABT1JC41_ACTCY|nr:lysine 2,3-aminomutase [Actinoalloteichus caeruleus]MCP2330068.1 lysine 2,3-aminomutase [Actinoalloteichus caeruleus DSM 43889]